MKFSKYKLCVWGPGIVVPMLLAGCEKPPQTVALKPFPLTAQIWERWEVETVTHPGDTLIRAVAVKFEGRNVLNVLEATQIPDNITPDTLIRRVAARKGKLVRRDSVRYGFGAVFDFSENTGAFGIPGQFHAPVYVLNIENRRYVVEFGLEYTPDLLDRCLEIIRSIRPALTS
jgi:hypothetical protein